MTKDEIDGLTEGDLILYGKNRTPRVVRYVCGKTERSSMYDGYVRMIEVAIQKCSWTGRCNTFIDRAMLRKNCTYTGINIPLDTPEDIAWQAAVDAGIEWDKSLKIFNCCDSKRELAA